MCISFEFTPSQSPYYDIDNMEDEDFKYREKYVDLCVGKACEIFIYDDRGVDIYSDTKEIIYKIKQANKTHTN